MADLRYRTPAGRGVLLAAVLGSGIAFLDATVVNVALPAIDADLGAGLSGLQWVVDAYLLTLSAFLLLGGSLGDLYGRRRVFVAGLVGFGLASIACGVAPTTATLIVARALQGLAAALLVPGSLAMISASFAEEDRSEVIGAWAGLTGVASAVGPLLGGWLVDAVSWRLVFLINPPIAAIAVVVALRRVPETRDDTAGRRVDLPGALVAALGLGGITAALIEGPVRGWGDAMVATAAVVGAVALVAFVVVEARTADPMLPLAVFRSRQFSGANVTTFAVYAALGGALFLVVLELQTVLGYSPLAAGAALLPITVLLLLLSPSAGRLADRIGPRWPMTVGPVVAAAGLGLLAGVGPGSTYLTGVLPGVVVFGLGLSLTVTPLTSAALAAVERRHAGIASGVNNAVARVAGLLAVALLPVVSGLAAQGLDPESFTAGYRRALWLAAALCAAGGLVAAAMISDAPTRAARAVQQGPAPPA